MTRTARRLLWTAALVAAALVLGRVAVSVVADIWWVQAAGTAWVPGLIRLHGTRLGLDAAGIVVAAAWLAVNLLLALRLVERVEIPRYLANLEFRETLRRGPMRLAGLVLALVLAVLVGQGLGARWREAALWLAGARSGLRDPVLGKDLAAYTVHLPLLEALQGWAWRLALVTLAVVLLAYLAIGAIQHRGRHLSIAAPARRHLAVLLALLALVIGTWTMLQPALALAGGRPLPGVTAWRVQAVGNSAMLGVALGVAAISAAWAVRARGSFVAAGWIVLGGALFIQRTLLPSVVPAGPPVLSEEARRALDGAGWALRGVDQRPREEAEVRGPALLWEVPAVQGTLQADSSAMVLAGPAVLEREEPRPVWLAWRQHPTGGDALVAMASDTATAAGGAISWRLDDPVPYPGLLEYTDLPRAWLHPGAAGVLVDTLQGVPLGGVVRRAVLAWALQSPDLLSPRVGEGRADWRRTPHARLSGLMPWAEWEPPRLVLAGSEPWWVVVGVLAHERFPGSRRIGGRVAAEPVVLGAVRASDGQVMAALLPAAGPVARRLARSVATGLVPMGRLPARVREEAPYPEALFLAQASVLGEPHWAAGRLVPARGGRTGTALSVSGTMVPTAAYEDSAGRAVRAVLVGRMESAMPVPVLARTPDDSLPGPLTLEARWRRFPLFEQLADSVGSTGGRLEPGAVQYRLADGRLVASQAWWSVGEEQRPALRWITVARGSRLGAGRSAAEAWANLAGSSVPTAPGAGDASRLQEVRGWFLRAEAALRDGAWDEFGRALEAMRTLLEAPAASPER